MVALYTQVAAAATVWTVTPLARPAVLAIRPAMAAPKLMPSERMVGIEDAVRLSKPGSAMRMVSATRCRLQAPMPRPISPVSTQVRSGDSVVTPSARPMTASSAISGPPTMAAISAGRASPP